MGLTGRTVLRATDMSPARIGWAQSGDHGESCWACRMCLRTNFGPSEARGRSGYRPFFGPKSRLAETPPFPAHAPGPPRARMRERSRGVALHCTASAVARRAYGRDGAVQIARSGLRAGVHASCRARRLYVVRRVERWIGRSASLALAGSQPVLINRRCALFVSCHHPPSTRSILRKQRTPASAGGSARDGPMVQTPKATSGQWSLTDSPYPRRRPAHVRRMPPARKSPDSGAPGRYPCQESVEDAGGRRHYSDYAA